MNIINKFKNAMNSISSVGANIEFPDKDYHNRSSEKIMSPSRFLLSRAINNLQVLHSNKGLQTLTFSVYKEPKEVDYQEVKSFLNSGLYKIPFQIIATVEIVARFVFGYIISFIADLFLMAFCIDTNDNFEFVRENHENLTNIFEDLRVLNLAHKKYWEYKNRLTT